MSLRTDDLYLVDLIEAADALALILAGRSTDRLAAEDELASAVLWKLYILTEAASRISEETRDLFTDAPWDEIRGFRNRMAHGYFTLESSRVWEIATRSVPPLRAEAERVLAELFPHVHDELVRRRAGESGERPS